MQHTTTLLDEQLGFKTVPRFKPTLKVFIACEDKASFLRAQRIVRNVEDLCSEEINLVPMYWAFALLRHDTLRECAAKEAANAEMIVLSYRGTTELPPHVKCWVESLPSRPQSGQGALVVLVKFPDGWAQAQPDISYLRQIAESRGLDFFCNRDETPGPFTLRASKPKPIFPGVGTRSVTPPNMFSFASWNPGGLND